MHLFAKLITWCLHWRQPRSDPVVGSERRRDSAPVPGRAQAEASERVKPIEPHSAGRRGVVFRSLDAARLLPALVGSIGVRMPYVWSTVRFASDGDVRVYTCRRRSFGRRVASRAVVRIKRPIAVLTELESFLTARWGVHLDWYGRTLYLLNEHPSWPLFQAELTEFDDGLIGAAGLPQPSNAPLSVLYSPGVSVRFGKPLSV